MNLAEKCKLYIKAGIAYEKDEDPVINDDVYDLISRQLLKNYSKLPKWFTRKISESDLETASAAGFVEKFGEINLRCSSSGGRQGVAPLHRFW